MRTYNSSYMLYLSEEQRSFITDKAKRLGVSSSQYCRMLIQKQIESEKGNSTQTLDQFIEEKGV